MLPLSHFGWEPQSVKWCAKRENYHNTTFWAVVKGIKDTETDSKNENVNVRSQQLLPNTIHIKLCERSQGYDLKKLFMMTA